MLFDQLYSRITDPQFILMIASAIAVAATIISIATPLLEGDALKKRVKAVSIEREKIRARERARLEKDAEKRGLRVAPKAYMLDLVNRLKLRDWLNAEGAQNRLQMAGYRGQQAEITFLFFRFVAPIAVMALAVLYVFFLLDTTKYSMPVRLGGCVLAAFIGLKAPELYLSNTISKRQLSITRAFPDALDLLLICVESGMSIEQSFRKVSEEVGNQSIPLAEEFMLATAELSYLSERRQAYENLSRRTGLDSVKAVCTALGQSERYGTPVGQAMRVLAQEFRDTRMNEAEKKAAALPPKLTVPMILFFLPVLFVVILGPAGIQVFHWK
ncbi:type II secretion system F family protein [Terrarubrum flagellatum]|uniref:type II secretion system F family protein n=1 Tax=Terrirubrum flagellatum TaxID=2895980 RepID=UPI003144DBEE